MERFESEYGTLTALALFFGRTDVLQMPGFRNAADRLLAFTTVPAIIYLIIERVILRANNSVMGAR